MIKKDEKNEDEKRKSSTVSNKNRITEGREGEGEKP